MCCHLGEGFPSPQWQLFAVAERCRILVSFFRSNRLGRASCSGAVGVGVASGYFVRPISGIKTPDRGYLFSMHLGLLVPARPVLVPFCVYYRGTCTFFFFPYVCLGGGALRPPSQRYKDTSAWVSFQHALGLTCTCSPVTRGVAPGLN